MSISGLVIHATPGSAESVRDRLSEVPGVEVHASAEDGRIVITVDQEHDGAAADTISGLRDISNVLSVSLVYSHFDGNSAGKEPTDEPIKA